MTRKRNAEEKIDMETSNNDIENRENDFPERKHDQLAVNGSINDQGKKGGEHTSQYEQKTHRLRRPWLST